MKSKKEKVTFNTGVQETLAAVIGVGERASFQYKFVTHDRL